MASHAIRRTREVRSARHQFRREWDIGNRRVDLLRGEAPTNETHRNEHHQRNNAQADTKCSASWSRVGNHARTIAAFTLSGVNGTERKRTPVAAKTAFEIAAGTTAADGSPLPQGFSSGRSMRSITTSGTSGKPMMR